MILERADWGDATGGGRLRGTAAKRVRPRDRCPGCGYAADAWLAESVLVADRDEFYDGTTYDSMACCHCGYTLVFEKPSGNAGGKREETC